MRQPKHLHRTLVLWGWMGLLAVGGCGGSGGPVDETGDPVDGKADTLAYEGTATGVGLLAFVNDASATLAVLDDGAGLDRRAAAGIVEHRDGPDGVHGTGDDDPFDDLAELDAVPYVGAKAFEKLIAYAALHDWIPMDNDVLGVFDGVSFTVAEANAVLTLVNVASEEVLDEEVGLDRRAVDAILAARPIDTMEELAACSYVGASALEKLKAYALPPGKREIGIISDLDKTVIPEHDYETDPLPEAPYPGVTALYNTLEFQDEGYPGDVYYVTARTEDLIEGIPEWLESHGLPIGPIETGVDNYWEARAEKVRDISGILDAHPNQNFILFGDSSHLDPEVMQDVIALYPGRVAAGLIHLVNNPNPDRLDGLHGHHGYAEAAAILFGLGHLSEDDARGVMLAAMYEGFDISEAGIEDLLDAHRP